MLNIQVQIEKRNGLAIYIDEELWRKGDAAILGKKPALPATCASMAELEALFTALEYQGAKRYAYKRLAMKSMPSFELNQLLTTKHVSEAVCCQIVDELKRQRYLNDDEWAEAYVKWQSQKKQGPKAILQKLHAKGYKNAGPLVATLSQPEHQKEAILKIITTRYRSRDLSDHYERSKVIAALMRKGFDLEQVLEAIKQG